MMLLPTGTSVRIHIAADITDMRKGMDGLAMLVERVLREDPFSAQLSMLLEGIDWRVPERIWRPAAAG